MQPGNETKGQPWFRPVWLEAELVIAGQLTEVPLQLLQEFLVAHGLLRGDEGVELAELRHRYRKQLRCSVQFHRAGALEGGGRGREEGRRGGGGGGGREREEGGG